MITLLILAATAAIIGCFTYTLGMYLEGRSPAPERQPGNEAYLWVFLIPCLNEERVIGATLRRLLANPCQNRLVVVIDDASEDGTAAAVRAVGSDEVVLLQRRLPNARLGKGAALNAAMQVLRSHPAVRQLPSDDVICCLLDADGRLDPEAIEGAAATFGDPRMGGVQVAVRIGNRKDGLLPRLQDMEFVCYTELFQRCRSLHGFAGLGGNGQFTRLSALRSLGRRPWSPSILTEDLDLGVRLVTAGWFVAYSAEAAVHQQGLRRIKALVRQRSRWFQGLLQCWRLIPLVAHRTSGRMRLDMLHMLLSPVLIFAAFPMTLSFVVAPFEWLTANTGPVHLGLRVLVGWYLLTFFPAALFGVVYRRVSGLGVLRSLALGHLFVLYGLLWVPAGTLAVGRLMTGRHGWLKTDRLHEPGVRTTVAARTLTPGDHEAVLGQVTDSMGHPR